MKYDLKVNVEDLVSVSLLKDSIIEVLQEDNAKLHRRVELHLESRIFVIQSWK